jgi:hypothetical protein
MKTKAPMIVVLVPSGESGREEAVRLLERLESRAARGLSLREAGKMEPLYWTWFVPNPPSQKNENTD